MKDLFAAQESKAYDETPYTSFPFQQTNPALIRSISALFGLNAPALETAKILEIGCASGNNILSIAARYPKSKCVGIDYSAKQIEEGQATLKASGIKNLKLECKSIMDIDKSFGEFDYIISHGVFSWIPKDVQEKMLKICSENLSKDGVAYVSYNTLPGWSAIRSIRDMMIYHTKKFSSPKDKALQSRGLLKFISQSLKDNKSFYAEIINSEMNLLESQSDYYLLHEHLEENNTPYYFHEFMDMAGNVGLQYLAETSLPSMFSGNMPKETADILATADDIVHMEQYMDFINNRRFRSTLLCHKDRILRRKIQPEYLANMYFTSLVQMPEDYNDYKFNSGKTLTFKSTTGSTISTSDPLMIAALHTINSENTKSVHFEEIFTKAKKLLTENKMKFGTDDDNLKKVLLMNMLRSIFAGNIIAWSDASPYVTTVSKKPTAFKLASYQAQVQNWVANMRQENISIADFDKYLLALTDGTRDINALVTDLIPVFTEGKLTMNRNDKKVEKEDELQELLKPQVENQLNKYAVLALLEK